MRNSVRAGTAWRRRSFLGGLGGGAALLGAAAQTFATPQAGDMQDGVVPALRDPDRAAEWAEAERAEAMASVTPPAAVIALNRMAFGARPGDFEAFNALGSTDTARLQAYVYQQLDPSAIDNSDLVARLTPANGYTTLGKSLSQLWTDHVLGSVGLPDEYAVRMRAIAETERAAFVRAIYSRAQLVEVLADFWHNHFNVYGWDYSAGPVFVHYDRDVIRANVLGNFRQMLEAVARSTSMLYYLDNYTSSDAGPNENFARELLELHTLGAENYRGVVPQSSVPRDGENIPIGYVDEDVYEAARCFTGWTVRNGHWQLPGGTPNDGTFYYFDDWHDRFQKNFLGLLIGSGGGEVDGEVVLDRLASHPGTARHIARKLCRRLVADNPPQTLVDYVAQVFRDNWQAPNQLATVTAAIVTSPDFLNSWGQKTKRPFEAVVSALRAGNVDLNLRVGHSLSDTFMWRFGMTGQRPFYWPAPNGYPDMGTAWQGTSSLAMTWKMLDYLVEMNEAGVYPIDVQGQTLAAFPLAPARTAANLAGYWLARILGNAPETALRQKVVAFMAQNGDANTYPIVLEGTAGEEWHQSDLKRHYNRSRLRTMVGMVLLTPEFLRR